MMQIIVLAAGGQSQEEHERVYPIWLSEIDGTLVIERQIKALSELPNSKFVFMFSKNDIDQYSLDSIVSQIASEATIIEVRKKTSGAACTALLAADKILMDDELIVASATDEIRCDFSKAVQSFRDLDADVGLLTFSSLHPRYSYVRTTPDNWVIEASEKRPISRQASAGFYWFRRASDFFDAAFSMILKDAHVQQKFYICPSLNELILRGRKIAALALAENQYHPLKSEAQLGVLEHISQNGG